MKDSVKIAWIKCPEETNVYKDLLTDDTDLNNFLTDNKTGLWTTAGQDTNAVLKNICNLDRVVNIATLYLAKFLGISISKIMDDFTYDPNQNYVYPNSSNGQTVYPPVDVAGMPDLPQVYWTIVSQYTSANEKSIRLLFLLKIPNLQYTTKKSHDD